MSRKGRLAAVLMAACVVLSGCGVRMGMEKVDEAKQAKNRRRNRPRIWRRNCRKGKIRAICFAKYGHRHQVSGFRTSRVESWPFGSRRV